MNSCLSSDCQDMVISHLATLFNMKCDRVCNFTICVTYMAANRQVGVQALTLFAQFCTSRGLTPQLSYPCTYPFEPS
jgi:hypothetical protein